MASAPTAIQQPLNLLFQALLLLQASDQPRFQIQIFLPHLQAFQLHLRNHARGKGSYWHPASGNGSTGTNEVVPLPKKRNEGDRVAGDFRTSQQVLLFLPIHQALNEKEHKDPAQLRRGPWIPISVSCFRSNRRKHVSQ